MVYNIYIFHDNIDNGEGRKKKTLPSTNSHLVTSGHFKEHKTDRL